MPKLVLSVITHLPNQEGYHAQRLNIVKACLTSMRVGERFTLVWDNGSCDELRDWLINEFKPDQLVLSPNVGKASARAAIFRMFPPETVIATSDDDMYFYPGWLEAHLEILDGFPPAVVSGYPVRALFQANNSYTLEWAEENAGIATGRFIPKEWMEDYAKSIGARFDEPSSGSDTLITYKELAAYANSQHCQFMARAADVSRFCVWDELGSPEEASFDSALNAAGLLRLSTTERYTRHIGNVE